MMSISIEALIAQERAQDEWRVLRREFVERLEVAKHESMAAFLRESGIVPELLACGDCGEPLAPWPSEPV